MTKITETEIKKLKPETRITDEIIKGFVARCLPSGEVTFGYAYTNKATGKRKYIGIGLHGNVTVERARELAAKYSNEVAGREDPAARLKATAVRSANTVDHVLDKYLENREREKARSVIAIRGNLLKHVRPVLGTKVIYELERDDIMRMLDAIGEHHHRMPGIIYAYLRAAFNFWMLRDSKFKSPIIKGMVKENTKLRTRVLKPDEIADLWRVLEGMPAHYAACVKVLFLTACRRNEVAFMHTDEIDGSTWRIPPERFKTKVEHLVPLVPAIRKLLPKKIKNGYVFGANSHRHHLAAGAAPLKSLGNFKEDIDATIALMRRREHRKPMAPWTYHDLRRTARTMLAELGISDEIAERLLGHSNGKIAETYNHHRYLAEKTAALTKLADHVERITTPHRTNAPRLRVVGG